LDVNNNGEETSDTDSLITHFPFATQNAISIARNTVLGGESNHSVVAANAEDVTRSNRVKL